MSGVLGSCTTVRNASSGQTAQTALVQPTPTCIMREHTGAVWASAFFKDGRRVVTGSRDHTLRIWDVNKRTLVGGPFKGHGNCVRSVAISPDDKRIASGGDDQTIIIWDVETKQKVFSPLVKHTGSVRSVCFSPNGKRLASGSNDFTVVIWDAETGAVLSTLNGHSYDVYGVIFSPDGLKLASGSLDRTIRVWSTDNAELLLQIAHQDGVRSVVWSPDGQQLVSASNNATVNFWSSSDGHRIDQPCIGHTDTIYSLAISTDGTFIATASADNTVRLWSTESHQQLGQALKHTTVRVYCVAISHDGALLVSGDYSAKVRFWSVKTILEQHKAQKRIRAVEEARRLLSCSNTQLCSHDNNEPTNDIDCTLASDQSSGSDDEHSSSDIILATNTTVLNASIAWDPHTAEEVLTQEINANDYSYDFYANRSVVRARNSEWDKALQDADKSITIQPSLFGYISKGIALCGNDRLWDAMEVFDLAFPFSNRDQVTIDLLLLIKAVALFNASRHDEAMRRVQDLTAAYRHSGAYLCGAVNLYMTVQLAIVAFEDGRYSKAADHLDILVYPLNDFYIRKPFFESRLMIFTILFGWDFDSLRQTAHQRRCEAFLRAGRVVEAVGSIQCMMSMIDDTAKECCLEWSNAFKEDCIARCVLKGDEAAAASDHDMAIELYSAGIELDSSCAILYAQRGRAKLGRNLFTEAIQDAEMVIELNPLSHVGYELSYAALHGAQRYNDAIDAFKIMLSMLEATPDAQIRKLRQQYVSPFEVEDSIQKAIYAHLENAPLRLLNTFTGCLCDRQAQINTFKASTEYQELLSSSMKHPHLQTEPIRKATIKYFRWVMLSHRWEHKEPLLHDIQDKIVYDLGPIGTVAKLQTFCKVARDAGCRWAWSDTCCIDQNNNVELQRSVNSMFVWYRQSALTIVYLSDVPPSAKSGSLAKSVWITRGWTVQEFLAPTVVLFYQADWTLYLNDRSPNHKESGTIMQELEYSTGIDAQALTAFRPGMSGAREKLQWASTRATTMQEDIAYSLFGIFGIHLPVIYGESKQNALGRLLQEIVAQSGDISALDWAGKSSEFNSCLPADITSYKPPPCTLPYPSEDQMQMSVLSLRDSVVVELASTLYARLDNLTAPRFANRRLHLPCIAFPVTELRRRRGQDPENCFTYDVKADGLDDLLVTTQDKLVQFSPARPTQQTFLLVRPWNRYDLGLPDFEDDARSAGDWSESESLSYYSFGRYPVEDGPVRPDDMDSRLRELRLIARLGQPFGALLLAQQRGGEYKRIASNHNIIAQVRDLAAVQDMMDVRTLEIL